MNKSTLYILIAFFLTVFVSMFLINQTLKTVMYRNINCAHTDKVIAIKEWIVWRSPYGLPDEACGVRYTHNGREKTTEWWNVGWCNDRTPIEIYVHDSSCH